MTTCTLRPAQPSDAPLLSDLALRSKGMWPYTQEFLEACRDELSYTAADIISDEQHYVLACRADEVLGFYGLRRIHSRTIELEALFIEPAATRQGIGQQLMHAAVAHATKLGARELTITSDPYAEPFYASMGAVKFDERESGSVAGRFLPLMRVALSPWQVRLATLDDAPMLAVLAQKWFVDAFGEHNNAADVDEYVSKNFGSAIQSRQILDAQWDSLLLLRDHDVVGYTQVTYTPAPAELELAHPAGISRFYLDASVHGSGAAMVMLDAVRQAAYQRGAQDLWLGVWEHNARAIAYYRKAGFEVKGAVPFLFGEDMQQDLLMVRRGLG